jgi:hypothetical protein
MFFEACCQFLIQANWISFPISDPPPDQRIGKLVGVAGFEPATPPRRPARSHRGIDLAVFDAVTSFLVQLVKADLLAL